MKVELERIWGEYGSFYKCLNEQTQAVISDVDDIVNSYNYEDCDGTIDYFDVDFYYFGCARNNGEDIKVVPKTPKIKAPKSNAENKTGLRVIFNDDFNGIEVYFPSKPEEATRTALKSAGYRWHNTKKCWYTKNTEENLQALRQIELTA